MNPLAQDERGRLLASVNQTLEARRISAWQWLLVGTIMMILVIDGLDIQLLSLVAPVVIEEWSSTRAEFGIAMSAALIGMAIGSGIGGYLGDRLGKRRVLFLSMAWFGTMTLLASLCESVVQLAFVRLASGIGFGAAAPTGVALAAEWLPRRARAGVAALLSVGTPLGGILGASAVLALLDGIGWRGCFIACGLITLVLAVVSIPIVPEAPSRLVATGNVANLQRFLRRLTGPEIPVVDTMLGTDTEAGQEDLAGKLFDRINTRLNAGSWLAFFSLQFIAYAFAAWAPVFLTVAGFTTLQAVSTTLAFNFCAVGAAILTSGLLARWGSRMPLLLAAFGACAAVILMSLLLGTAPAGRSNTEVTVAALASGLAGGSTGLGIATIYGLLSHIYPAAYRATGLGSGMMIGRAGGICIALSGGALLTLDGANTRPFFAILSGLAIAALAGAATIDRHVPSRSTGRTAPHHA